MDGISYVTDVSRFAADGERQHSSVQRDQGYAKLSYAPSSDGRLTLVANAFRQQAEDPLGLTWGRYQSAPRTVENAALQYNTRKSIDQSQGGLSYEHRFGEQRLQVSAYVGQRSVVQYQSIPSFVQANPTHSGGVIDFDRQYGGVSGRWIARQTLAGGQLTTTLGVDYEQSTDERRGYENFVGATLGVRGALRRNETDQVSSFDQYVQSEWQGERWAFSGGIRHSRVAFRVDDHYIAVGNGNDSGQVHYDQTTPTLGLVFRATPTINLYASAARGFETPSMNELFYSGAGGSFSFALKPSTSVHLETGLKAMLNDSSRLDLALFQVSTRDELIVSASSGGRTSYQNAGKTRRRGLELGLDTKWAPQWKSRLALTHLEAIYDESFTGSSGTVAAGNRLPAVPQLQLFTDLVWRHPANGWHAAVEGMARGEVMVEDMNTRQAAPGFAIANLRVGVDRQLGALKVGTFARIDNLFDRHYVGSVVVGDGNGRFYEPGAGRNWLLGMSLGYRF